MAGCEAATLALCETRPDLSRVRGHVECYDGTVRAHWWCVSPNGAIVDPTAEQFAPWGGAWTYHPLPPGPEPRGRCLYCGALTYRDAYTCSAACAAALEAHHGR